MNLRFIVFSAGIIIFASSASADTIAIAAAGNSAMSPIAKPSLFGGSFISLTSVAPINTVVASVTAGQATITSPDGLETIPYSSMYNAPNEIFDNSPNGTANISVQLTTGTSKFGIGVADGDGVSITLQALNSTGVAFGSVFTENLNNTVDINGDSYFVLSDATADIYGVKILQTTGNANYSGLAIGDLQVTPEPSTLLLLGAGGLLFGALKIRGRA